MARARATLLLLALVASTAWAAAPAPAAPAAPAPQLAAGAGSDGSADNDARLSSRIASMSNDAPAAGGGGGQLSRAARLGTTGGATVSTCLELKTAVDAFRAEALKTLAGTGPIRTITLSCAGTFECVDPSAAEGARDVILKVAGRGQLTITSEAACATGDKRPRLFGSVDFEPTEFFYVGLNTPLPDSGSTTEAGGIARLTLSNLILDGEGKRSGVFAQRGGGVTLINVDMLNGISRSAYGGGCMSLEDTPALMTNVLFKGCTSLADGGAVRAEATPWVLASPKFLAMTNVVFDGNTAAAGSGGALAIIKATKGAVVARCKSGCKFIGNSAATCGVLMSDRFDMNDAGVKIVAGKGLTVDFGLGATFTGNTGGNGLRFCGRAELPFLKTKLLRGPGLAGAATETWTDYTLA